VYPKHYLSIGEVAGDQRAYMLGEDWTALDFANCHPNIMCKALAMSGRASEFTNLGEYCSNRDCLLKEVMATYVEMPPRSSSFGCCTWERSKRGPRTTRWATSSKPRHSSISLRAKARSVR
jgi:hypothetical protein